MGSKTLKITYLGDAQSVLRAQSQISSSNTALQRGVSKTASFFRQAMGVAIPVSAAAAGLAVVNFTRDAIRAASEHEQVLAHLRLAVGQNTAAYEEQATALMKLTGFDDEQVLAADAVLARFKLTQTQIQQLIPLTLDYAAAVGVDAATAAGNLGKALLGNTRALKTIGINYKATGDRAKDFAAIVAALQGSAIKGSASADTLALHMRKLQADFEEIEEAAGRGLIPILKGITDATAQILHPMAALTDESMVARDALAQVAATGETLQVSAGAVDAFSKFVEEMGFVAVQAAGGVKILTKEAAAAANQILDTGREIKQFAGMTGKEFATWRKGTVDNLNGVQGALDDLARKANVTAGAVLRAFDRQLRQMKDYQDNWQTLLDRHLPESLIKQLQDMGLEGAGIVTALADANKRKFDEIIRDWELSQQVARRTASTIDTIGFAIRNLPESKTINIALETALTKVLPHVEAQHGFHGEVRRPTVFLAGEAGRERVDITPRDSLAELSRLDSIAGNSGRERIQVEFPRRVQVELTLSRERWAREEEIRFITRGW